MKTIFEHLTSAEMIADAVVVTLAVVLCIVLKRATRSHLAKAAENDKASAKRETYISLALNIARYIVLVITVLMILQTSGVNVTSLIAGLGIASAVAGLALQDLLKDVIMGSNIISNDFFTVGDLIRYNGIEGVVISFTVKATKIRDIRTNDMITICNRNISEITVRSNWLDIVVPTSYDADPNAVRGVLDALCGDLVAATDADDCVLLGTDELAASSVNYRLRLFARPETHPALRRAALGMLYDRLNEQHITVPYQQVDVHSA